MRHDVYKRIKIFMIHGEKTNFSWLGHRWGVDRHTVKAAYERELVGKTKDRQLMVRPSKLDDFREIYCWLLSYVYLQIYPKTRF
ncbi:hypothetical protein [Ligilactobacillus agilis]|uniref:hypothetical protein n=1 Tax=Ligilactobacillus agilis TaxID=1601 RepID=UPI001EF54961|nr:hypothetical protein [Ligilactobacillus agilis]